MKKLLLLLAFASTLGITPLSAKVLLLLPGYHENAIDWHRYGVTQPLMANGWGDGGPLLTNMYGVVIAPRPQQTATENTFYLAELPTEAPLEIQQRVIGQLVQWIGSKHAGEPLHLAGHSAGGVAARLFMVRNPQVRIASLTTISAPHLGSGLSEAGLLAAESPLSPILPFMGAQSLNRSEALLRDLSRESQGNILTWLNRQPHPQSRYISVVRRSGSFLNGGDWVVHATSQNMNFVVALQGRSEVVMSRGDHDMNPGDGMVLLNVTK